MRSVMQLIILMSKVSKVIDCTKQEGGKVISRDISVSHDIQVIVLDYAFI